MATTSRNIAGKERGFDARPDRVDFRDREYRPPLRSLPPEFPARHIISQFLPAYVEDGMVLNQGKEGACTGFGLAAVINYIFWGKLQGTGIPVPAVRQVTAARFSAAEETGASQPAHALQQCQAL